MAKPRVSEIDPSKGLVFSFRHLDTAQRQPLTEWEKDNLLSLMLDKFRGHCQSHDFNQCFGDKFKKYTSWPPRSDFKHPNHVPEDATWSSMHIQGKECVIGHMIRNVFYVVFLDRHHRFYITDIQDK